MVGKARKYSVNILASGTLLSVVKKQTKQGNKQKHTLRAHAHILNRARPFAKSYIDETQFKNPQYIYKSPCISFIKSAYASSLVPVSATLGCETCCGTLSTVSGTAPGGRSFALLFGCSRLTRRAVGTSFVSSA